jgi:hypothetical protein
MKQQIIIKEKFLFALENILPEIQKIPLYTKEEFNLKFKETQNWPGLRSQALNFENPILFNFILRHILEIDYFKINKPKIKIWMYIHLRRNNDSSRDWVHQDSHDHAMLIYLNKTNVTSGTYIYDKEKNIIGDIKYVQNRMAMYNGNYFHMGYGHFGENSVDGRLSVNCFINELKNE